MSFNQGPGWWQASDAKWYPPESHPSYRPPAPVPHAVPPVEAGWTAAAIRSQPQEPAYVPHKQGSQEAQTATAAQTEANAAETASKTDVSQEITAAQQTESGYAS